MKAAPSGILPDEAFARLAASEDRSFWFRSRNRLLLWALASFFPDAHSFLEVGCGNGFVLAAIASARPTISLTGSDLSAAGLKHAAERVPGATLVLADARACSFDEEFDVAGAFDVIEHIADDGAALAAMRRAVKPGGGVMVTVPQHRWLWSETDRFSGHQRRYSRRQLAGRLESSGLRVRYMTSFVTLLLPLMAASRAAQAVSRRPFDPQREFDMPGAADLMLERVMRAELALIRRGIRLPAGGSLLVIAERPVE